MNHVAIPEELSEIDQLSFLKLRVVAIDDPNLSPVTPYLKRRGPNRLCEVWLLPQDEWGFSERALVAATVNSAEEVCSMYDGTDTRFRHKMQSLRQRLQAMFFSYTAPTDLSWHYSVLERKAGPVISIVFGTQNALAHLYADGIRRRQRQR